MALEVAHTVVVEALVFHCVIVDISVSQVVTVDLAVPELVVQVVEVILSVAHRVVISFSVFFPKFRSRMTYLCADSLLVMKARCA